jgi:hypothetical protein
LAIFPSPCTFFSYHLMEAYSSTRCLCQVEDLWAMKMVILALDQEGDTKGPGRNPDTFRFSRA